MIDQTLRHHIFLQRYSAQEMKKLRPALKRLATSIKRQLRDGRGALTQDNQQRLVSLLDDITATINENTAPIVDAVNVIARPLAINELEFYETALAQQSTVLPVGLPANAAQIVASNAGMVLVSGQTTTTETIDSILRTFQASVATSVRRAILEDGILKGESPQKIISNVAAIAETQTRRNAEAVVRTAVNAVSSEAQQQVAEANADLLQGMKWLSTLDGRTSPVCRARDGRIYPIGDPTRPPAHYRCRSVMVMILKPEYRVAGFERTRSSPDGYVSEKVTYQSWLRRQPVDVQREILGDARYKLFSKGGLTLDSFVDERGVSYTLEQLRATNQLAFEKAGI